MLNSEVDQFKFNVFENKFPGYSSKVFQEYMYKWGMQGSIKMIKFGYDQYFKPYQTESFLSDFFNDEHVQTMIKGRLGNVSKVSYAELEHNVTSLAFFDALKPDIVRSNGSIIKCLDEYYESFVVSDQLRKCLLMEEDDVYTTFSESDRKEFIFHVFKSLCLGGACCQFEDELGPYLDSTRMIYKDMIT